LVSYSQIALDLQIDLLLVRKKGNFEGKYLLDEMDYVLYYHQKNSIKDLLLVKL